MSLSKVVAILPFLMLLPLAVSASPPPGRYAKICMTCHKTVTPGEIRGNWDAAVMKSKLLQVRTDADTEVVFFEPGLQVLNAPEQGDLEKQLSSIKRNAEIMVLFDIKNGKRVASSVVVKPKLKVPDNKIIKTEELEKLIGYGPRLFNYALFDARPKPIYDQGTIPTAQNLPFPAFEQQKFKLPKDKNTLVVFYCSGVT